jgi:hypothetical protein
MRSFAILLAMLSSTADAVADVPERHAPKRTGTVSLRGRVLDRATRAPIAGVSVTVGKAGTALTDADGRFVIELVAPGKQAISLEREDFRETRVVDVSATESSELQLLVELGESSEVIEVHGEAPIDDATNVTVSAGQAATIAGSAGDVLKVVGNLPGVARQAPGSGDLVIWGSAPAESRVYMDGVELPALYHAGGYRSVLPSAFVSDIELLPGAYGIEYGRSIGGIVEVESAGLPEKGFHGSVAADLLDTSAWLTAAGEQVRAGAGARISYLDRVLAGAVDSEARALIPVPRYYDAQARTELLGDTGERFELSALASGDQVERSVTSPDPTETRSQERSSDFIVVYGRYRRSGPHREHTRVVPFVSYYRQRDSTRFGVANTELNSDQWSYGLRAESLYTLTDTVHLSAGFDGIGTHSTFSREGTLTLPPREGDITVFGQPPGADVSADHWITDVVDAAPYAAIDLRHGSFGLRAGLRLAALLNSTSRKTPPRGSTPPIGYTALYWLPEPRLSVSWEPSYSFALHFDAGLHHQAADASDLSAVFGTPTLAPLRAIHGALAGRVRLRSHTTLQPVLFYKRYYDLPARSGDPMPLLAAALEQNGDGQSYGGQLLIRQQLLGGLTGWLAYTVSRSERRASVDSNYRLLDFDQTHVLTAVANYQLRDWNFGTRLRWATGMPRTPVVSGVYDSGSDLFQPVFGAQNTSRLPDFIQLDVRIERVFPWRQYQLRFSLDILNLTNRKNAEEIVYSYDYGQRAYFTGLPTLAVLGMAFVF